MVHSIAVMKKHENLKLFNAEDFHWIVGRGDKIRCWLDSWREMIPLYQSYNRLYNLFTLKEISIGEMVRRWENIKIGDENFWRRKLRGWELSNLEDLGGIIRNINLTQKGDVIKWKVNDAAYSSVEGYNQLQTSGLKEPHWNIIWKAKIPAKVKIFLWQAIHKVLPTASFLSSRGLQSEAWCAWCNKEIEDINHLIWNCDLARKCWNFFHKWWELQGTLPSTIKQSIILCSKEQESQGKLTCMCATIWTIWLARNERIFSTKYTDDHTLKRLIQSRSWQWSMANGLISEKWKNLWMQDPLQAYKRTRIEGTKSIFNKWFEVCRYVGCIDGAWSQNKDGIIKAGIGGFIMDNKAQVIFIFSGPCMSISPYQSEERALQFMIENLNQKNLKDISLLISSDSSQLINAYNLFSATPLVTPSLHQSIRSFKNLKLAHLNRRYNSEADRLATEGTQRKEMVAGWVGDHSELLAE